MAPRLKTKAAIPLASMSNLKAQRRCAIDTAAQSTMLCTSPLRCPHWQGLNRLLQPTARSDLRRCPRCVQRPKERIPPNPSPSRPGSCSALRCFPGAVHHVALHTSQSGQCNSHHPDVARHQLPPERQTRYSETQDSLEDGIGSGRVGSDRSGACNSGKVHELGSVGEMRVCL